MFASSNWRALQQTLSFSPSDGSNSKKRRRPDPIESSLTFSKTKTAPESSSASVSRNNVNTTDGSNEVDKAMILRPPQGLTPAQREPGKYLAIDCEMVGVGPGGEESSLARVSIVNFYGAMQLDAFVRQREAVTDWRTAVSGIRPSDMVHAKPFLEVQKLVSDLTEARILIGHAIENDLKALLLSQPRALVRDTQRLARKSKLLGGSRWPGLKKLVVKEFGITIQAGEHDSLVDARATMALFRKHRHEWESSQRPIKPLPKPTKHPSVAEEDFGLMIKPEVKRRKTIQDAEEHPGAGVKGVSSGFSTVVRRRPQDGKKQNTQWWSTLTESQPISSRPSKGSVTIKSKC